MTPILTLLLDLTAGPAGINLVAVLFYASIAGLVATAYIERN
jgi:hypothetical protein